MRHLVIIAYDYSIYIYTSSSLLCMATLHVTIVLRQRFIYKVDNNTTS